MKRRTWLLWLPAFVVGFITTQAHANIVTITSFPLSFENVVIGGFRFSPSCHIHGDDPSAISSLTGVTSYPYGSALSFDCAGGPNQDYLGTFPNTIHETVYIDAFGQPFNFLDLDHIGLPLVGVHVFSSKGGHDLLPTSCFEETCYRVSHYEFSGGDWNGVRWVVIAHQTPGASIYFFDNLRFQIGAVPAPGTIALLLIALAGLAIPIGRRPPALP
jgi:hypothetical protein